MYKCDVPEIIAETVKKTADLLREYFGEVALDIINKPLCKRNLRGFSHVIGDCYEKQKTTHFDSGRCYH